jgi:hypothetical protein
MARLTTPGIWLPGPLNTINSSSQSAQADIAGNPFWMGLNAGKMVVLSTQEAQAQAVAGTSLYDGSYQYVQLDSGATAANATVGMPAYLLLNQGAQGVLPETQYQVPTVTTADIANTYGLNNMFCGVFINPTTYAPTPGNWTMIFVGGGRASLNYAGSATLGHLVAPTGSGAATFTDSATAPTAGAPINVQARTGAGQALAYFPEIILRFAQ